MLKVNKTQLKDHLFCEFPTIDRYKRLGLLVMIDGGFDQDETRKRVLQHLRDLAVGRARRDPSTPDLAAAKALLAAAQRERIEIDIAQKRGEVVSVDVIGRELELEYRIATEKLLSIEVIADALANDVEQRERIRVAIHDKVTEVLNELSAPARLIEGAAGSAGEARPSAERLAPTTESKPDRLGRRVPARRRKNVRKPR